MRQKELKVPDKKIYRVLNAAGVLILAAMFLSLLFMWSRLPDQIPSHFGVSGEPDAWSGKGMLWFCPVTAALLYGLLSILERFPELWNTGVELTRENQERVLGSLKLMVVCLKLGLVLIFGWMTFCSALQTSLGAWFLPLSLLIELGPVVFCLIRIFQNPRKS